MERDRENTYQTNVYINLNVHITLTSSTLSFQQDELRERERLSHFLSHSNSMCWLVAATLSLPGGKMLSPLLTLGFRFLKWYVFIGIYDVEPFVKCKWNGCNWTQSCNNFRSVVSFNDHRYYSTTAGFISENCFFLC